MLALRSAPACSSSLRLMIRRAPSVCSSHVRGYTSKPKSEPFKILFCGSDSFSVAILRELLAAEDTWQTISVLTPPEQRVGRNRKDLYTPPLMSFAHDHAIPTYDLPTGGLQSDQFQWPRPFHNAHDAHLLVTASFGHIIPTRLLEPFGANTLNVHPSVLPRYRGAAPVQWAIANRDPTTGVSVQTVGKREAGVDSGSIMGAVEDVPIPPEASYSSMLPPLSDLGGKLLVRVLRQMLKGEIVPRPQDASVASRAPKITNDTARVDWSLPAAAIEARHRAFRDHTHLWSQITMPKRGDVPVQLVNVTLPKDPLPGWLAKFPDPQPATAFIDKRGRRMLVATGDGFLQVDEVVSAGRAKSPPVQWWAGLGDEVGKQGWARFV